MMGAGRAKEVYMAKGRVTSREFLKELQRIGSKYPEFAGKYAVTRVEKAAAASAAAGGQLRCVKWGTDPVTGERICLKWEKV
jgi:hypothetical protein